jgi:benzoate/toluate 1,2-dioxygenase beta subunit
MSAVLNPAASQLAADEKEALQDFVFEEARLADESEYDQWEALVDDDMLYWVPGAMPNPDPDTTLSVIADHRGRLRKRIAQLNTGRRLSQQPVSPMRRLLSNLQFSRLSETEFCVRCNFALYEYRMQSTHDMHLWAGRCEYRIRRRPDGSLRMFYKRVDLINVAGPLPSLAFLI